MSESELKAALDQARREMAEAVELCHQAIALASAANVRVDGLAAAVAKLEARIDSLKAVAQVIVDIQG